MIKGLRISFAIDGRVSFVSLGIISCTSRFFSEQASVILLCLLLLCHNRNGLMLLDLHLSK